MQRSRLVVFVLALLTVGLGFASRRFPGSIPDFVKLYAGDALWAMLAFWVLAFLFPRADTLALFFGALFISFAAEASQLYRTPWLDAMRSTRLGALVLGQGFLLSDLASYTVGAIVAALLDRNNVARHYSKAR